MAVDGGVAAAIDDAAPLGGDLDPVAVAPHRARAGGCIAARGVAAQAGGVVLKVAAQIAVVVGVAPKKRRHGRHRLGDHQFTDLVDHRLSVFVPGLHAHAEQAALHLAGHHGQLAVGAHKGARVGAARNVAPPNVVGWQARLGIHAVKLFCAPALHLGRQG